MTTRSVTVLGLLVAIVVGWLLVDGLERIGARPLTGILLAIAPSAFGAIVWRLEGHSVIAIASLTVPLLAATCVSVYALDDVPSVVLYLCCVMILAAMTLTRSGPLLWKSILKL